ncbi:MAG: YwiC-like family protein [Candidatus Nanopelagicales bacterium]
MPPQHGAWAFLGLPVVGEPRTHWTPLLLALALTWVGAYPTRTSCSS